MFEPGFETRPPSPGAFALLIYKEELFFFSNLCKNREIYIQSYMNKTLFTMAISGEYSNYVFYDQNWKKKILKLLFIFYIKSFLYGINHLFIQVLENLVDLAYSSSSKTKSRYAWFFCSESLQYESAHVFLRDPYTLRGGTTFPSHLNTPSINTAFNFFFNLWSQIFILLNSENFPIHVFSLALVLLKLK